MDRTSKFSAVMCAAVLAGCGADPAKQAPIEFEPGLYSVSLGGEAYMAFVRTASDPQKDVCVSADKAKLFPQQFPRRLFSSMGSYCRGSDAERVGNRISGTITCPFADDAAGEMKIMLDGEVAENSLDVQAKLNVLILDPNGESIDTEALNDIALRLHVKRIGDCA